MRKTGQGLIEVKHQSVLTYKRSTKKCSKVIHGQTFSTISINKKDLIRLASKFFRSEEGRRHLKMPLVFTEQEQQWEITLDGASDSFECNHEEADSRLVLLACEKDTVVVAVAKDTDALVILVHAYAIVKPSSKWFMKIDHEKYVDVGKVYDFLGKNVSMHLPHIHAISGDTTSFYMVLGKSSS